MKNLWNDWESQNLKSDLDFRVYTSNLLGQSDELVLHGGGNTSVKTKINGQDVLYVKGSGWDLVSIKEEGFAPVELTMLQDMARLDELSDSEMVAAQKEAMIDKTAPNPSVEAILHAIIPFKYVDHTHADAVVTISNSKTGIENIQKLYPNFLIVPYIMPGFILAHQVYEMTKDIDWKTCEGIILHNHGIFTFDDDPKKSYKKMIKAVTIAEEFLQDFAKLNIPDDFVPKSFNVDTLVERISKAKGYDVAYKINQSQMAIYYSTEKEDKLKRGVLTPEHIIRTKREPLYISQKSDIKEKIKEYEKNYIEYFNQFATDEVMLSPTPNYAVIADFGIISFGKTQKDADIIDDIISHTIKAVLQADKLGGYESISLKDSFEMEYWELEQAKLKK